MIQKLRSKLFRATELAADERGALSFIQLAALIIGPIVAGSLALGAISALRLGGDLTGMFTRDSQMSQMVERLQLQVSNITAMTVKDEHSFTVDDQPSKRSAYYVPSGNMPDVCVSNEWTLTNEGGTLALRNVTSKHAEDSCDSDVVSTTEKSMTGLAGETKFLYENAYGRDLTFVDGAEKGAKASKNARDDGLFSNEWEYASPGFITLSGQMNQVIGSTPLDYTAKTPLKQLRPGTISSELGELGPPIIERIFRSGDTYRAQMSALTVLNDPRTVIEWSWREAKNIGTDGTSLPTEAQWGNWSAWTTLDHFDSEVLQGSKWQVQAKYRVVLEDKMAESEIATMTWVRPIAKPETPGVSISLDTSSATATITVTPGICPAGTSANTRARSSVNDGAWGAWETKTAAPYTTAASVPQGSKVTANGEARCVTTYAQSEWAAGTDKPSAIQPITAQPKIDSVIAAVPVPGDVGTGRAALSACPAGTTYEASWYSTTNAGTVLTRAGGFAPVAANPTFNSGVTVREGDRFRAGISARCVSPHAKGSPATADSAWVVNPIRTIPTVTDVVSAIVGSNASVTGTVSGCLAWMTYEGRPVVSTNTSTTYVPDGAFRAIDTRPALNITGVREGDRFRAGVAARCVTPYAQGVEASSTDGTWRVRPITALFTLTGTTFYAAGTEGHLWSNIATYCPAWMTPNWQPFVSRDYQPLWASYGGWSQGTYPTQVGWNAGYMNEGQRFAGGFLTKCTTPYAEGPTSGTSTNGYTVRPITSQPWASVSAGWGTFYISGLTGCPAGTTSRWAYQTQNSSAGWSGWSGWMTDANMGGHAPLAGAAPYGGYLRGNATMMCRSDFINGPQRQQMSGWSGMRPYPVPAGPGVSVGSMLAGPNTRGVSSVTWSGRSSYASTYQGYAVTAWTNGGYTTRSTMSSASGNFRDGCYGSASLGHRSTTTYSRAGNSSGWSGWTGTSKAATGTAPLCG